MRKLCLKVIFLFVLNNYDSFFHSKKSDPPGKPSIKLTNVSLYEASFIWSISHVNHANEIGNEILNDYDLEQNPIHIEGYIISYRALIKRVTTFSSSSLEESFDQTEFIHSNSIDGDNDDDDDGDNNININVEPRE